MTSDNIVSLLAGAIVLCAVAFLFGAPPVHAGECRGMKVSWYGNEHHGRKTASGAVFNENALTAAMPSRAHLGEVWKVYHGKKSVTVKITDTGDFGRYGRGMDLSRGAFAKLAPTSTGVIPVKACRVG
mgnify:CR=1 FL=1